MVIIIQDKNYTEVNINLQIRMNYLTQQLNPFSNFTCKG